MHLMRPSLAGSYRALSRQSDPNMHALKSECKAALEHGNMAHCGGDSAQVRSAMFYTTTANITASGTSMACPVVSGVAALYMQANPAAPPAEARSLATVLAWLVLPPKNACDDGRNIRHRVWPEVLFVVHDGTACD